MPAMSERDMKFPVTTVKGVVILYERLKVFISRYDYVRRVPILQRALRAAEIWLRGLLHLAILLSDPNTPQAPALEPKKKPRATKITLRLSLRTHTAERPLYVFRPMFAPRGRTSSVNRLSATGERAEPNPHAAFARVRLGFATLKAILEDFAGYVLRLRKTFAQSIEHFGRQRLPPMKGVHHILTLDIWMSLVFAVRDWRKRRRNLDTS